MNKKVIFFVLLTVFISFGHMNLNAQVQYEIEFKLVENQDLPLIHSWLQQPYVKKWFSHEALPWQQFLTFRDEIKNYFGDGKEYLVQHHNHPFGYIRYYDAHLWPEGTGQVDPEGTYGIDLYIGDEAYLGKGFGRAMLTQFIKEIIKEQHESGNPIKKIVVDPEVENIAAIKTYLNLGFTIERQIDDPFWGKQYIMALDPELFLFLDEMNTLCNDILLNDESLDAFDEQLAVLMGNVWKRLGRMGITHTRCTAFLDTYGSLLKKQIQAKYQARSLGLPEISLPTIQLIEEVIIDYRMNPQEIALIAYHGSGSPAASDDYTLYIDENELVKYPLLAQRFVIAHELMHVLNCDNSFENALENLMDEHKADAEQKAFYTFAYTNELCADIDAILNGSLYAQGAIAFFTTLLELTGDETHFTHPKPSLRLKLAKRIHELYMQQEHVTALAA